MFDFPYRDAQVSIALATPILATLAGLAYIRWAGRPRPVLVGVPLYFMLHLVGLMVFSEYRTRLDSFLDPSVFERAVQHISGLLSLGGLAALLWAGIRKNQRRPSRGFDVIQR